MFNAAPRSKLEYEIGFFFGIPPGATGAETGGGDIATTRSTLKME
jgi:hypothetical protein